MKNKWIAAVAGVIMLLALVWSCSRNDDGISNQQKADVSFFAEKSKTVLKSANSDFDVILAGLDCGDVPDFVANGDYRLMVRLTGPNAFDKTYFLTFSAVGEGVASELIQLNADATYSIVRFALVEKDDHNGDWTADNVKILMGTPENDSAFMDYVSQPLPLEFSVGQYEKNRIVLELLCFNQQVAPAFGFGWFDYNIVEGDEVCVFINCIDENDPEYYHQVYPSYLKAWMPTEVDGGTAYWDIGPNYTVENNSIKGVFPVCFPLYAPALEMTDGLTLEIRPAFGKLEDGQVIYSDVFTVTIPQAIILEYLGLTSYVGDPILIDEARGITVKVDEANDPDPNVTNQRFIHLEYLNCLEDPNDPGDNCETAFAYYNDTYSTCFSKFGYLGIPSNRWGWTNGPLSADGTYTFDLYAGAAQCDLSKGTNVGTVTVNYYGSTATVTYQLDDGYQLAEAHLWVAEGEAGADPDPQIPYYYKNNNGELVYTVAPGEYEFVAEGLTGSTWTETKTGLNGGTIWVVAHATVCGIE
ncbi:hypothetical protein [Prolixibacter sp. SD074]|jgi:hypothetical protein|uniref:hypothetical protein n=1 Tax=Prolixibacter sp. SD074 TaxID=2652391 RepID=UPI001279E176|nr:hypothetical protein [Prolixibacter sp. SD074]GET30832.1 hypothetical protein SD074_30340 [Prolixibacter sp. SD074]